jgi:hypothetical protein
MLALLCLLYQEDLVGSLALEGMMGFVAELAFVSVKPVVGVTLTATPPCHDVGTFE